MLLIPICIYFTSPCKYKSRWYNKKHSSLSNSIRGNMWIRFLMEACLDISISGSINLYTNARAGELEWDTLFHKVNTLSLMILFPLVMVFPIAILVFYMCKFAHWQDEVFEERYGAVFEGLRTDRRSSLMYPFIFCMRRILLTFVVIIMADNFLVQLLATIFTVLLQFWYLVSYEPFKEPLMLKLEMFNEITTLVLLYNLMCFSAANIALTESESTLDISFMVLLCGNLCVHLFFLFRDTCVASKRKCKRAKCCLSKKEKLRS